MKNKEIVRKGCDLINSDMEFLSNYRLSSTFDISMWDEPVDIRVVASDAIVTIRDRIREASRILITIFSKEEEKVRSGDFCFMTETGIIQLPDNDEIPTSWTRGMSPIELSRILTWFDEFHKLRKCENLRIRRVVHDLDSFIDIMAQERLPASGHVLSSEGCCCFPGRILYMAKGNNWYVPYSVRSTGNMSLRRVA